MKVRIAVCHQIVKVFVMKILPAFCMIRRFIVIFDSKILIFRTTILTDQSESVVVFMPI